MPQCTHAEIPQAEYEALVALFNRTGDYPCSWGGVSCTCTSWAEDPCQGYCEHLHVTQLSSRGNKLSGGEIPSELGNLSSLTTLWLEGNELTGEIPSEIGNLSNLAYLKLHNNQLCGKIPSELMNLTKLLELALSDNNLINTDTEYDADFITWLDQHQHFLYTWRNQISPSYCPSLIQLSASNYNINEGDNSATITVTRIESNDGAISINYATTDGTATAPDDYTQTSGTINWADGDDTDKSITIDIIDDSDLESDETFIVSLDNPTGGAELGEPNIATVTIKGSVLDENLSGIVYNQTGETLSGVTIEIDGQTQTTDELGAYSFSELAPDEYLITASKENYVSITELVNIPSSTSVEKNFVLYPDGEIQVLSITSKYPENVHYLEGISHEVTYTANIHWGGLTPKTVRFITPQGEYDVSTTESTVSKTFNMGTEFGVGKKLKVKAISDEDIESEEKEAAFVIMSKPVIGKIPTMSFSRFDLGDTFSYKAPDLEFNTAFFNEGFGAGAVPEDMPVFNKKKFAMKFTPVVNTEIDANGKMTMKMSTITISTPEVDILGEKINMSPILSIESQFFDGNWNLSGGGIGMTGNIDFKRSSPFILPGPFPIPAFLKLVTNAAINGIVTINGLNPFSPEGKIGFEPSISGSLGVGIDEIVAAEVWVKGGVDTGLQFPAKPTHLEKFIAYLIGGVKVYALLYNWEKELGKCEWNYHTGAFDCDWGSSSLRSAAGFSAPTLIARDYLNQPNANAFLGAIISQNAGTTDTTKSPTTIAALQEAVFPFSDPELASNGQAVSSVWIMDNDSRTDINRTMAVSSAWNGTEWSQPQTINDDGTADFHPQLLLSADDAMLCAWEDQKIVLNDTDDFETMVANMEISVARYNPGSSQTWATPETAIEIPYPLIKYDTIFQSDSGKGLTVMSLDTDDDLSTIADRQLFTLTYQNGTWGSLTQLTTDDLPDDNPQLALDPSGNVVLVWLKDSELSSLSATSFTLPEMTERQIILSDESGYSANLADARLTSSPDGKIAILWAEASTEFDSDIYALFYSPIFQIWGNSRQLTEDEETESRITAAFQGNDKLIALYNRNLIGETELTTTYQGREVSILVPNIIGTDLYMMVHELSTDLALQEEFFDISPANPDAGNTATLTVTAENLSDQAIENAVVAFYNGDPAFGGTQIATTTLTPPLAPQERRDVSVDWLVPEGDAPLTLFAVIDPDSILDPINRSNNSQSITTLEPDLSVSHFHWARFTEKHLSLTARIKNEGSTPTEPVTVTFTDSLNGDAVLYSETLPTLAPYESKDINFLWDHQAVKYKVKVTVDSQEVLEEFDEDNNEYELNFTLGSSLFANDLIIDFGTEYGIWTYTNNSTWTKLHALSSEQLISGDMDGNGIDEIIIDFGAAYGIWLRMNNSSWVQLHSLSPESMVTGDIDGSSQDDVIIDFGASYGIWVWMNNNTWTQLHSISPESITTGDMDGNGLDDVVIDFGETYGIWIRMNNSTWVKLHSISPSSLVTGNIDGGGLADVIIDFGEPYGIWVWMNNNTWTQLHSISPESITTGDMDGNGLDDVVIDFGETYGIWIRMNNSTWVSLHSLSAESITTGDMDGNGLDDVVIDFGDTYGIWARMNNDSWVKLHTLSPESMVTGNLDGQTSPSSNITAQQAPPELDNAEPLPEADLIELPAE
ncbi:hypothetical protein PN36_23605 [Candidatus Thiomargarita nelsonii]|uniref:Calx-beta domain-containing protein n=1 Tax=Candidatus Thiomargarita nelsonii TaxID=1003181 RepID=A0A4E0R122_9GAMM|nr:hypothetical protein PN36_23605 [Candidatus Thiomargarita nelsonii]